MCIAVYLAPSHPEGGIKVKDKKKGDTMMVPISVITDRLGMAREDIERKLLECLCPIVRGSVYYQYLPLDIKKGLLTQPDDKFASYQSPERRIAVKRFELLEGWHEWLFGMEEVDREELWVKYCDEKGKAAEIGRGGKRPNWKTAQMWWRKYIERGLAGLCQSTPGASKAGKTSLTDEQQSLVISTLYHPDPSIRKPHLSIRVLRDYLIAETGSAPCAKAIELWLKRWNSENRRIVETLRNPDKARGSWGVKVGSRSEDVYRLNQRWELDGTKLDIICSDGIRYNIAVIIDIYSRRAKCLVSKTSTSSSLAMLVRDCITDWGVPEEIVCDNGKDYVSDAMTALWKQLGVNAIILPPFCPDMKPHVESFNRKLALRAELWSGFIGHNVDDRKAIESRIAFSARMSGVTVIRAGYSRDEAQRAINDWLLDEYHAQPHSALGCSPAKKAADYEGEVRRIASIRALDILLEPVAGTRTYRKGYIELDGGMYVPSPPEAMPQLGVQVAVRRGADYGTVYLYDLTGKYICEAIDINRLGVARKNVAAKIKQVAAEQQSAAMRELRKKVKETVRRDVNEAIADAARRRRLLEEEQAASGKVVQHNFRQRTVEYVTPDIQEAVKIAASADKRKEAEKPRPAAAEKLDDPLVAFEPPMLIAGNYQPLWDAWVRLDALHRAGESLCDDALAFYANFQRTSFWKIKRQKAA